VHGGCGEKMDFGLNKNSPPIRDVANKSITTLRLQQAKLDQANYRLRERDRILFKACTDAKTKNNQDKASMCANELVEVRRLAKFLSDMHLSIERVVLRLETIRELSDIVVDLRPALKLLQNVSSDLGQIMPNVSSELANVTDAIQDTLRATKIRSDETLIPVGQKTDGGEEILKEVSSFIQQRIVQDLPEPPVFAPAQSVKTPQAPIKELVALSATTSEMFGAKEVKDSGFDVSKTLISYKKSEVKEITLEIKQPISKQPTIDEVLFDYLRKCNGGEIDLSKCSNDLKTSTKEIERALENLGTQGKIKLELKSPE
jgi:division protein CdvB (Snf7/Vps24/ESCRT-III family)